MNPKKNTILALTMRYYTLTVVLGIVLSAVAAGPTHAASISISDGYGIPGDTGEVVTISLNNAQDYAGMELILQFDDLLLNLNRVESAPRLVPLSDADYHQFATGRASFVVFDVSGLSLAADTGVILNVIFDVPSVSPFGETSITVAEVMAVLDDLSTDSVTVDTGTFFIRPGDYCGNVNGDNSDTADISDLVYLIDYMFQFGPEPPVMSTADVYDCDGVIDISDLIYLINYMFLEGTPPCDSCGQVFAGKEQGGGNMGVCELRTRTLSNGQQCMVISGDFGTEVAGLHQEYHYDGGGMVVDSVVIGHDNYDVGLYYNAGAGKLTLGIIDIQGKHNLKMGKSKLATIYYHSEGPDNENPTGLTHIFTKAADRSAKQLQLEVNSDYTELHLPKTFALHQNYPNPFNPTTVIKFDLPRQSEVSVVVYNILGERVTTLHSGNLAPGFHQVIWDGSNVQGKPVASGVYFYKINAEGFTQSKKMVLLK